MGSLVRRTLAYLGGGFAIGRVIAASTFGVLGHFLFDTGIFNPGTLLRVVFLLGATALAAAVIPSRRAADVDPVQALQQE